MPRWLWWSPVILLTAVLAVFAFIIGWQEFVMGKTYAINSFAKQYVRKHGGTTAVTDCQAWPGHRDGVWIVIECVAPDGSAKEVYAIDGMWRVRDPAGFRSDRLPET